MLTTRMFACYTLVYIFDTFIVNFVVTINANTFETAGCIQAISILATMMDILGTFVDFSTLTTVASITSLAQAIKGSFSI